VIGTFGDTNWVRNLRAAGAATVSVGRRREEVRATELVGEEHVRFFREILTPYVKRLRVGTLLLSVLGAKDIVEDPSEAAAKLPVFELRAA
jgi:hypothetical protein